MNDKSELKKEIERCKSEISALREKLNGHASASSVLSNKKKEYSSRITALIESIKIQLPERKRLAGEIGKSISNKELLYKDLSSKRIAFSELQGQIKEIEQKHGITHSSAEIKKKIDELEFRLQTEVIPFEKEKEINKYIKKLKSELFKAEELQVLLDKKETLINELNQLKTTINTIKESIYTNRKNLKLLKENKVKLSAEIDKLKEERDVINNGLNETSILFHGVNAQLKSALHKLSSLSSKLEELNITEAEKRHAYEERITKERQELVLEKIKGGRKLTNEDLLAFQNCK